MCRDGFPEEGLSTQGHGVLGVPQSQAPREPGIFHCVAERAAGLRRTGSQQHPWATGQWGARLLWPRSPRKLTVLNECAKAQEPLLIFLCSSICESVCSFNQPWLWVPAPDTKTGAQWGPKVRVDPGRLLGEKKQPPVPECRAVGSFPSQEPCYISSPGSHDEAHQPGGSPQISQLNERRAKRRGHLLSSQVHHPPVKWSWPVFASSLPEPGPQGRTHWP